MYHAWFSTVQWTALGEVDGIRAVDEAVVQSPAVYQGQRLAKVAGDELVGLVALGDAARRVAGQDRGSGCRG